MKKDVHFDLMNVFIAFVIVFVGFCCCDDATDTLLATGAHVENEVGPNCDTDDRKETEKKGLCL
jgi:hypothetical protein